MRVRKLILLMAAIFVIYLVAFQFDGRPATLVCLIALIVDYGLSWYLAYKIGEIMSKELQDQEDEQNAKPL